MRVMVTGGAGYIGAVITWELAAKGHDVVVYDNLTKGHADSVAGAGELVKGDLLDGETLRRTLSSRRIEAVVHMAASSLVGESVAEPDRYYRNNVEAGLQLLAAMRVLAVRDLVFSSTAALYGEPSKQPIEESDPTIPTNPYGETKLALERAFPWYARAYGLRHVSLRYFNAAGATERCGERHDPETHLIPIVLEAARSGGEVTVFGDDYPTPDGTCVRDYIHVDDLAVQVDRFQLQAVDAALRVAPADERVGRVPELFEKTGPDAFAVVAQRTTAAGVATDDGHPGRERFEGAEAERLALAWQQKEVGCREERRDLI